VTLKLIKKEMKENVLTNVFASQVNDKGFNGEIPMTCSQGNLMMASVCFMIIVFLRYF